MGSEQTCSTHTTLKHNHTTWSEGLSFRVHEADDRLSCWCPCVQRQRERLIASPWKPKLWILDTVCLCHLLPPPFFFPPFFKLWEKRFLRVDDLPRITQMAFWQILRIFQLLMMWNFYFKVILDIKLVISDSKKILAKSCTNDDLQYLILTIVRKKKKNLFKNNHITGLRKMLIKATIKCPLPPFYWQKCSMTNTPCEW